MRIIRIYKLGPEDPEWHTRIDQAFNRVISFASELLDYDKQKNPRACAKAYNRVVVNREFDRKDWETLFVYGREVMTRAIAGAKKHPQEVADSIDQAALNLRDVLIEFDVWLATTQPEREA